MKTLASCILIACTLSLTACGDDEVQDLDMAAEDFSCILDWPKVDRFRIINELGHQAEAEAVARSAAGGTYPVGTIIRLADPDMTRLQISRYPSRAPRPPRRARVDRLDACPGGHDS